MFSCFLAVGKKVAARNTVMRYFHESHGESNSLFFLPVALGVC